MEQFGEIDGEAAIFKGDEAYKLVPGVGWRKISPEGIRPLSEEAFKVRYPNTPALPDGAFWNPGDHRDERWTDDGTVLVPPGAPIPKKMPI